MQCYGVRRGPARFATTGGAPVLAVLGLLLFSSPFLGGSSSSHTAPAARLVALASSGGSQERATCASINSNASLQANYDSIYSGLPPANQSGAGNNSSEVGQAGYPNTTVGGAQLIAAWTAICESSAYLSLLAQFGASAATSGEQLNGATGHYQAIFGLAYQTTCTNQPGFECGYQTNWYVDLVNGAVTGPITTSDGPPLGTPHSQAPGSSGPTVLGQPARDVYVGAASAGLLAIALVAVVTARRRRGSEATAKGTEGALRSRGDPPAVPGQDGGRASAATPPKAPAVETVDDSDPLGDVY